MKNSILFTYIILLTSCSGLYRFTIEVQEPAQVTLPPDIVDVLVVNNSAPQPGNMGVNRMYMGTEIRGMELNLDSVASLAAAALAAGLKESRFFDRILFSSVSMRNDKRWMEREPLTETFRAETFGKQGVDGIVSIDRLMIKFDQEVRNNFYMNLVIQSITTCTVYIYDRETPLTTFSVTDSLLYSSPVLGDTVDIFKNFPEYIIEDLACTVGERLSRRIVPSWIEKERFLYAGSQSRMAEALSFARRGKWNHASNLWQNEYVQASSSKSKGKTAANLAAAYEMLDQLDAALQWATAAQNHFGEAGLPDASAEKIRINAYVNDLHKRIRDNSLLDIQWGVRKDPSGNPF
ncbi:MAG: DUF6340 family protein [Dysgonamonadaceae bacterium]|jgi:hypothetical protein|nr:DUF6340 family protein [Dysgonamonadaceae bacterium]